MSDALHRGITVTEIAPMDRSIDAFTETTGAFVGRALRGPLNTPVLIENFAAFRRRFGGIWNRSSLGPAVEQFFEHGGRRLYVVRVANNARGAMICLPAEGGVLSLRALEPGSTENIRAAVDYDGIVDGEHFNLTVQRIAAESGLVADQEIYLRLACSEMSRSFVGDVLMDSSLVRVSTPIPENRPSRTTRPGVSFESSYIGHAEEGDDGSPLSDYDLVGSARSSTGLFALDRVDHFDLLYLPPPARHRDLGPAAILAAEQYCRKRGALMIMDPPAHWLSAEEALGGLREFGLCSANTLGYFPRMLANDDAGEVARPVGGAIAGSLCKLDRTQGPWQELDQRGFGFDRKLKPAVDMDVDAAHTLVREGVNVIAGRLAGRASLCGSVTLGHGAQIERLFASLTTRRLCLMITNTIERAIRWAVFEPNETRVAHRIDAQIHAYMASLADAGAFADANFVVQCDAGLHTHPVDPHRGVTVLLVFRPAGCDESISLTLHQTVTGCRVATTAFAPVAAA